MAASARSPPRRPRGTAASGYPEPVAISADGRRAYVAVGVGKAKVIDLARRAVIANRDVRAAAISGSVRIDSVADDVCGEPGQSTGIRQLSIISRHGIGHQLTGQLS